MGRTAQAAAGEPGPHGLDDIMPQPSVRQTFGQYSLEALPVSVYRACRRCAHGLGRLYNNLPYHPHYGSTWL